MHAYLMAMPGRVKIINETERIFSVHDAARRLRGLGMTVSRMEALSVPYEIDFPFVAGAADREKEMCVEIRGTYAAISELQKMVN